MPVKNESMAFEKIDIAACIVIIGFVVALILAIFYRLNELDMSIASGMLRILEVL